MKRSDHEMNNILLVAYHFPPSIASGATRPAAFARYLPQWGWKPTILTVGGRGGTACPAGFEDTGINRVAEWPHPLKGYERFKERRAQRLGRSEKLQAKWTVPYTVAFAPSHDAFSLKRWLFSFLWLPDREMSWLVPAVWRGLELIKRGAITHLITTGPPFTCHVIGFVLTRLAKVRWIADFRDPWSLSQKPPIIRNRITDVLEGQLIRKVMESADLIVSVTPSMTEHAKKELVALDQDKFVTVTNGFDPSDFEGLTWSRPVPGPVVFAYVGRFYYGRSPEPFLRALRSLIDDGAVRQSDVRIKFVGEVTYADGRPVSDMARQFGLEDRIELKPPVPRREALREMLEAHVALVFDERHPMQVPLKLYEALASGTVVFNIGSGGATADVVTKTGRGVIASYQREAEIRKGILECILRSRTSAALSRLKPWRDADIEDFDFRRLTGHLAGWLNRLKGG